MEHDFRWLYGSVSRKIRGKQAKLVGEERKLERPTWGGPNNWGLSRQHIMESINKSLARLRTDHVDRYQAHGFDPQTPIEETLRAFEDLVTAGKVRYVGCSNYPAWRLGQALRAADKLGVAGYVSVRVTAQAPGSGRVSLRRTVQ